LASITESQQQISLREQQVAEQKGVVQKYKESIPKTTAQQLRGQAGRGRSINPLKALMQRKKFSQAREKVGTAEEKLQQYEKDIKSYKQQLEEYVRTPSGRLQYAKEEGIEGEAILGRPYKGASLMTIGYRYQTPYGEVEDYSPQQELLESMIKYQESLDQDIERMGYTSRSDYLQDITEKALAEQGVAFEYDTSGQLLVKGVPEGMKEIKFKTLFGTQSLEFKPTSAQEKADLKRDMGDINDLVINEIETPPKTSSITGASIWGGEMFPIVSAQERDLSSIPISQGGTAWEVQPAPGFIQRTIQLFKSPTTSFTGAVGGTVMASAQRAESFLEPKFEVASQKIIGTFKPVGQQMDIQPIYMGEKEFTGKILETPTYADPITGMSIGGTPTYISEIRDITSDYSRGPIRRVEEVLFPAASIPLTMTQEQVYIQDKQALDKFKKLSKPGMPFAGPGGAKFLKFVRDQQSQYKKDMGRYNLLKIYEGSGTLSKVQQSELNQLKNKLKYGQRGTVQDVIFESTRDTELGRNLYTALRTGQAAYEGGKLALAFELGMAGGAAGLGRAGLQLPKLTGTASQINWLKGATASSAITLGGSFAAMEAAEEYQRRGDISSAIGVGVGTGLGLFGGQALSRITGRSIKPLTFEEKLRSSQQRLAQEEKDIAKMWEQRMKLTGGETGIDPKTGLPLPRTSEFDFMGAVISQKVSRAEAKAIYNYLEDAGLISGIKKSDFLKDAIFSTGKLRTRLPSRLEVRKGSLGDIPSVAELKTSDDVLAGLGKREANVRQIGLGFQDKVGGKQLNVVYQVDEAGNPIKNTIELQVATSGKDQKFSIIEPFRKGRKSKAKIKTDAGEFILYKESPIIAEEPYIAKVQTGKLEDTLNIRYSKIDIRGDPFAKPKRGTPEEILGAISRRQTNKEIGAMFQKGQRIEETIILEETLKGGRRVSKDFLVTPGEDGLSLRYGLETIDDSIVLMRGKAKGRSPLDIDFASLPKPPEPPTPRTRVVKRLTTKEDPLAPLETKQIAELEKPATVFVPPKRVVLKPETKITKIDSKLKTKTVGDPLFADSVYTGKGDYDILLTGASRAKGETTIEYDTLEPKIDSITRASALDAGLILETIPDQMIKFRQDQKDILETRQFTPLVGIKPDKMLDTRQIPRTKQKTRTRTKTIVRERSPQTKETLAIKQKTTLRPSKQQPKPPKPPIIKPPKPEEERRKKKLKKKERQVGEEFLAITKRKGKEVIVGLAPTAEKAAAIGRKTALETLGATVKVKEKRTGKQVALRPDRLFRASKTDPLAIVQRKEKRLAGLGERKEIKQARRSKKPFSLS